MNVPKLYRIVQSPVAIFLVALLCFGMGCRGAETDTGASANPTTEGETPTPVATERDSVRVFWEHFREATRLRQEGDFAASAAAYEAAIEYNDRHGDALYYLGNVNLELERWEAAHETWLRLVEVDPESVRGHARLGNIYLCRPEISTFDLERAKASFERAHDRNPGESGPTLRLAEIAVFEGDLNGATERIEAVLGSDEQNLEALFLRAFLEWKAGRLESGLRELNDVLESIEEDPTGPIPAEGDTYATGGGGPAYASGFGCPLFDNFVEDMVGAARPVQTAEAALRFTRFEARIDAIPSPGR